MYNLNTRTSLNPKVNSKIKSQRKHQSPIDMNFIFHLKFLFGYSNLLARIPEDANRANIIGIDVFLC